MPYNNTFDKRPLHVGPNMKLYQALPRHSVCDDAPRTNRMSYEPMCRMEESEGIMLSGNLLLNFSLELNEGESTSPPFTETLPVVRKWVFTSPTLALRVDKTAGGGEQWSKKIGVYCVVQAGWVSSQDLL